MDDITSEVATNAIHFAVTGKRNKVMFTGAQGGGSVLPRELDDERAWWKTAGAVILGIIAIAGTVFGLMQVQGWHFG